MADAVIVFSWIFIAVMSLAAGIVAAHDAPDTDTLLFFGVVTVVTFVPLLVVPITVRAWAFDLKRRQLFMDRN